MGKGLVREGQRKKRGRKKEEGGRELWSPHRFASLVRFLFGLEGSFSSASGSASNFRFCTNSPACSFLLSALLELRLA